MPEVASGKSACSECPLLEKRATPLRVEHASGCSGPTTIEYRGVVASLAGRGQPIEVRTTVSERYCAKRQTEEIEAAIGTLSTENRIVRRVERRGEAAITVARGPARLLTQFYGAPPSDTPRPERSAPSGVDAPVRPRLEVLSGTISTVHAQLDAAVHLLQGIGLPELLAEADERATRLTHEVDGTGNSHARAMQAAATAILYDLRAAVDAGNGFVEQVQLYKQTTGGG